MDNRQKRILSIFGFIAVVAIFSFGWLIFNNDKDVKPTFANEDTEMQTKEQTSEQPNDTEQADNEPVSKDKGIGSIFTYNQTDETTDNEEEENTHINENKPTTKKKPDIVKLGTSSYLKVQAFNKDGGYTDNTAITFNGWSEKERFFLGGTEYREGIGFEVNYGSRSNTTTIVARYSLNGEYTKLVGEVGIDDKSIDSTGNYRIEFYAQNRDNSTTFLGEVTDFKAGQFPIPFEVDVTDVPALLIELVKLDEKDSSIHVAIVNSSFE